LAWLKSLIARVLWRTKLTPEQVAKKVLAKFLGRFGVVGVSVEIDDEYGVPYIFAWVTGDSTEARRNIPREMEGRKIFVVESRPLVPYAG